MKQSRWSKVVGKEVLILTLTLDLPQCSGFSNGSSAIYLSEYLLFQMSSTMFRSRRGQLGRLGPLRQQGGPAWTRHLQLKVQLVQLLIKMSDGGDDHACWQGFQCWFQGWRGERGGSDHWRKLPHPCSQPPGLLSFNSRHPGFCLSILLLGMIYQYF